MSQAAMRKAIHTPTPGLNDWLGLLFLGLIWGASFMAITVAGEGIGPISVTAGRIALAALILYGVMRFMGLHLPRLKGENGRKTWTFALGFGFFSMALPFFLLSWGQLFVASGFAGVTMAAGPLLTLVLAHFLVPGETITTPKAVGISIGFVGVVLLIGLDAFKSSGLGMEPLARLACIGAAASYAIGAIITKRAPSVEPIGFATAATALVAVMMLPVAFALEGLPSAPGFSPVLALIFLGVVPTALANLLLVSLIRSAGPSFLSLVNYQVPVWSVIFGWLFLNEILPGRIFIALGLILVGVAISQIVRRKAPVSSLLPR